MSFVVLDTDAASHLFRGKVSEQLRRHTIGATLAVMFITVGELTKWTWAGARSLRAAVAAPCVAGVV